MIEHYQALGPRDSLPQVRSTLHLQQSQDSPLRQFTGLKYVLDVQIGPNVMLAATLWPEVTLVNRIRDNFKSIIYTEDEPRRRHHCSP